MAKKMNPTPKRWRKSNYGKGITTTEELHAVLDNFSPFVVSSLGRTRKWKRSAVGRKIKLLLEASVTSGVSATPELLGKMFTNGGYVPVNLTEPVEDVTINESSEETTEVRE